MILSDEVVGDRDTRFFQFSCCLYNGGLSAGVCREFTRTALGLVLSVISPINSVGSVESGSCLYLLPVFLLEGGLDYFCCNFLKFLLCFFDTENTYTALYC